MKDRKTGYIVPEAVTHYIDERNHFGWRLRGERAVKFAGIKEGDSVLDLCCGPGMVTKVISEAVGPDGKVVGIDISRDFIKYAKTFCGESNAFFITGNVENLNKHLRNQKFDSAIILASWFWIKNKERLCGQVKNYLKPDGRFLVNISSDNLSDPKTRDFYWTYRAKLKDVILETSPLTDLSYFDNLPVVDSNFVDGIVTLVNGCGFCLQSQNEVGRLLTLEDKLFTYNNPARTEWVGNYSPDIRLAIIRQALNETANEISGFGAIKRHTYYLLFGLNGLAK